METKRKKILKPLLAIKEVYQAVGFLVNKVANFTEAFKYAIASVPLAVAILNPILYQLNKAGLTNYVINVPTSSAHEYPGDIKWVADGLAAIRSALPPDTNIQMKNGPKHL